MFRRPNVARQGAPLLRGALAGDGVLPSDRAAVPTADRDDAGDTAVPEPEQAPMPRPYATPPQRGSVPRTSAPDLADKLDRLTALHEEGILTDAEFAAARGRLLGA